MESSTPPKQNSASEYLNSLRLGLSHIKAMFIAGTGFFTDAYDLFIIGVALALIKTEYHPSTLLVSILSSTTLLSTFIGALLFGRLADALGRKTMYGVEATIMAVAALLSAFSPNLIWLIGFRFLLGIGIGGDYPVSSVIMSEFANVKDRGKLVSMVFSMQALGLVIGPIIALILLSTGLSHDIVWRLLLGLGAIPAAAVIYVRRKIPESPRYLEKVKGDVNAAAQAVSQFAGGVATQITPTNAKRVNASLKPYWLTLVGTAGTWFLVDYGFYGNSILSPVILKDIAKSASLEATTLWTMLIFLFAALPGYVAAFLTIDKIGHKTLQLIGFTGMALAFATIGFVPGITSALIPFVTLYAISYFFTEFGPNTTTFVIPTEVFPVNRRTTAHGISAAVGKFGAFVGTFILPILIDKFHLSGALTITAFVCLLGMFLTLVLPEPAGKSVEDVSKEDLHAVSGPTAFLHESRS